MPTTLTSNKTIEVPYIIEVTRYFDLGELETFLRKVFDPTIKVEYIGQSGLYTKSGNPYVGIVFLSRDAEYRAMKKEAIRVCKIER